MTWFDHLTKRALALSLVLLVGCSAATSPTDGPIQPSSSTEPVTPIAIRLRGTSFRITNGDIDAATRKKLAQDAVLHGGDGFELELEIDRPAHAYVLQFLADGTATVLHPAEGAKADLPAGVHRLPVERDVVFRLDEVAGPELLYVIVSQGPLRSAERQVLEDVTALPKGALYPVAYTYPPEEEKAVDALHEASQPAVATAQSAPSAPAASSVPPSPPPAPRKTDCGPKPMVKTGMKARDVCGAVPAKGRAGLKARAVERVKLGQDIASGATERDGVATFVLRIQHRAAP